MSEHRVTISWQRGEADFDYKSYSRDHTWRFAGGREESRHAQGSPRVLHRQLGADGGGGGGKGPNGDMIADPPHPNPLPGGEGAEGRSGHR